MADSKITALTAISTVDPTADPLVIVDVSDTSMAASGTTKKSTINQLLGSGGTATLASATITGDLTVDTSTLKVDSTNNRVGIGTASPNYILDILGAAPRIHLKDNGTGSSLVDIENGAGTLFVGRENSTGSGGLSGVPYAGIMYLQGAYPLIFGTNLTERYRIDSTGISTWSVAGTTAMTLNSTGLGIGVVPVTSHILSCAGPIGISGTNSGTRTSYITNSSACSIYYTDGGGSGYFTDFGNLIIQPRTSAARSVVIATGSTTPVERAVVKSTGQVRFVPLAADPAGAEAGDVYYNSSSNKLKCYNGTTWNDLF